MGITMKKTPRISSYAAGLLLVFALLSTPASSMENKATFDLQLLQKLFKSYQRQQAYLYAQQHLAEMEGDPYFDYYYGVSAIDAGKASQGVFALERVLLSFPNDLVARLELARGYFLLEEYALARESFELVLQSSPPSRVRDTAEAYLDRIRVSESRYRPTHSGNVSFSLGNDDNVNGGVDEDAQLEFVTLLDPDSLGQDDNFLNLAGAWTYTHPFSPGWFTETSLSGQMRSHQDLDQFNSTTGTLQLGLVHLQGTHRYKAQFISQLFNLDSERYRTLNSLLLEWKYSLSEQSSLTSSLQLAQLDYPNIPSKNSDLSTLAINYLHSFSSYLQPLVFVTFNLSQEAAEENSPQALADTERDISGLRAGIILSFTNTLALQSSYSLQNSEYDGDQVFPPGPAREDDYTSTEVSLLWALKRKWRLDTRYNHTENDSNVNLRDYQRNTFEVSLNYTF